MSLAGRVLPITDLRGSHCVCPLHEAARGPECVKTRGRWELTIPVATQIVAYRSRKSKRQFNAGPISKARPARAGLTPASPSSQLLNRVA
jgi:hypothetical protein